MKIVTWIIMLVMCAAIVTADSGISIGGARQLDERVRVDITNSNDFDLDNARVRVFIPELGIFSQSSAIDLDDDDRTAATMHMLDEVPEGEYLVRISVRQGSRRRVVYRYVIFE